MRRSFKYVLCLFVMLCFCFLFGYGGHESYAASTKSGTVQSLENQGNSVLVKWKSYKNAKGYYIYRKGPDDKVFKRVTVIKDGKKTSWKDKYVLNGRKYTYKVCAYKKKKTMQNTVTKSICHLDAPEITLISTKGKAAFDMQYVGNKAASGYEIMYANDLDFIVNDKVKVKDPNTLEKTIKKLEYDSFYYVKIRAYLKDGKKTSYSGWSKTKLVYTTRRYSGYSNHVKTYLYDRIGSGREPRLIWYMTEAEVLGFEKYSSTGGWLKIKYDGKIYFAWQAKDDKLFVTEKSAYVYEGQTPFEMAVIEQAYKYLERPNMYGHDDSSGIPNEDGVYVYDCSGFVGNLISDAMQEFVPVYRASRGLLKLYKPRIMLNKGMPGAFKSRTVCNGEPDEDKLRPGDVVFFKLRIDGDERAVNHCAVYLGNSEIIQCTGVYGGICIAPLRDMYERSFVKVMRFFPEELVTADQLMCISGDEPQNIYSNMRDEEAVVDTLEPGSEVTVLFTGNFNKWAYVHYGEGKYGCIRLEYLSEPEAETETPSEFESDYARPDESETDSSESADESLGEDEKTIPDDPVTETETESEEESEGETEIIEDNNDIAETMFEGTWSFLIGPGYYP